MEGATLMWVAEAGEMHGSEVKWKDV